MNARDKDLMRAAAPDIRDRVAAANWRQVSAELDGQGAAVVQGMLTPDECCALAALYPRNDLFRSRVVMARHGFGKGEYQYFRYPLPVLIDELRQALYVQLAPIANRWHAAMGMPAGFPERHADFIERCHAAGQTRPTPLLLQYAAEDYNCLHQDLYGDLFFPLQVVTMLSRPGRDFEGGELVMTEQRPRMQSRALVLALQQGDAALIAVNQRPVQGSRGVYRVRMKHGVSRVHCGLRHTAGIIFHDAT